MANAVDQDNFVSEKILERCNSETVLVVLGTTSAAEQPGDFQIRVLVNPHCKQETTGRPLEAGRLVTGLAAALLERSTLRSIACVCYLAPREPVLSLETLDCFHKLSKESKFFLRYRNVIEKKRREWTSEALKKDEQDSRRFEPEGMFM
jgi:hypothetical protein